MPVEECMQKEIREICWYSENTRLLASLKKDSVSDGLQKLIWKIIIDIPKFRGLLLKTKSVFCYYFVSGV